MNRQGLVFPVCLCVFVVVVCFVRGSSGGRTGGQVPLDVNDRDVVRLSHVALSHLNENKGSSGGETSLVEIVQATRQVVSGTLTRLILALAKATGQTQYCRLDVWERHWLNKVDVTNVVCDAALEKVREPAGHKEVEDGRGSFESFKRKYGKVYADVREHEKRFRIFRANLKKIQSLRENEQGTGEYGVTQFADLTSSEFKKYLGFKPPQTTERVLPAMAEIPDVEIPQEHDWREYNVVTPVKNQGMCGSCWAFSVTGNVEGQWALKKHRLLSLSEQELVDCDKKDDGCEGGYMTQACDSIASLGGLETEQEYPYDAKDEVCQFNRSEVRATVSGAVNISKSEDDIARWVYKNGPASAALNANAMQFYMGGVSHPLKVFCSPKNLDHGILIVGYGVHHSRILKRTLPYWLIKNSWGKTWGEGGYYKLYRGDGSCGINQMVSSCIVN